MGQSRGGRVSITPVEIRNVDLRRSWLLGYRRRAVDELLDEIAESFGGISRSATASLIAWRSLGRSREASRARGAPPFSARLRRASRSGHEGASQARIGSDRPGGPCGVTPRHPRVCCREAPARGGHEQVRAQLRAAFELLGEWPQSEPDERGSRISDCAGGYRGGPGKRHS